MLVSRRLQADRICRETAPERKKTATANAQPNPARRRTKYAANRMNSIAATSHQTAGLHAYTPTTMPAAWARAAHSMGWRGACRDSAGGDVAVVCEFMEGAETKNGG